MFHGLMAYTAADSFYSLVSKANGCLGKEVCTSDKPIGAIGLFVSGEISGMYSRDCWSFLSGGSRVTNSQDMPCEDLTRLKTEIRYYKNIKKYKYSEIFLTVDSIDCIWIKKTASLTNIKKARVLGRLFKIPVIVVTEDSNALNWT